VSDKELNKEELEDIVDEVMEGEVEANEVTVDEDEVVEEETSDSEDEVDGSKEKKSFFKKDKKEKKDKKDQQIDELNDRLIRTMAEFDNFRKRSEREKSQMFEIGAKDIIEKILPIVDNFERGLDAITEEEKEGAFVQGIEKIYKQFVQTLEDAGVKPIEAVGKEFDPNLHNAVMHAEDDNLGENIVSDEFQKGYMYKETVIRHSMVKVVN
jgi:molecular chaperone GrpE